MNGAAVSWRSKKQTCEALSTAEAEFVALSAAAKEALWMLRLLTNLSVNVDEPVTIYQDNQLAISMSKNQHSQGNCFSRIAIGVKPSLNFSLESTSLTEGQESPLTQPEVKNEILAFSKNVSAICIP